MSDWQSKSDFEINKAVAKLVGVSVCEEQYLGLHDRDENVVLCVDDIGFSDSVDYCNEASDAWPIIFENKIDLTFAVESLGGIGQAQVYIEGGTDIFCEFTDNNKALRAAMIVHLEINGVKP